MSAQRTFIFWTAPAAGWSRIIIRVTGRQLPDGSDSWSHMGLGFTDAAGEAGYFEALLHHGFTGPHPGEKLISFSKRGGRLAIEFLPANVFTPAVSDQIRQRCLAWTSYKSYHAWQLALMWAYERFGRRLGWRIPHSPGKVVCSEAVACLLWPYLDLRDAEHPDFDSVNPNSAWRSFLARLTVRQAGPELS